MMCIRTNEGKLLMSGARAHPKSDQTEFYEKQISPMV